MRLLAGVSLFLLAACWQPAVYAQQQDPKIEAQRLQAALAALKKNPSDPAAQARYLKAFPQKYTAFLDLFDYERGGELCEQYDEYVQALSSLAKSQEAEVGRLLVTLSKDAGYKEDAVSDLQQATTAYASHYSRTFIKLLGRLTPKERLNLISFLADTEAIKGEPKYQLIIDNIRKLGEQKLAKEFESARTKRARLSEHH